MCGIFGLLVNSNFSRVDQNKFKKSAMLMKHRGPNAYGQWGIPGKIELAHLRLSIIDLNPESNQPFFSNCKNYVIVFNGEIYNYIEIKRELQLLGYNFRTSSDTEVLLTSYIEWGEKCVSRFNGIWAFAIYNIKENTLFCSRDRFGVKPFNYAVTESQFIFSSEIKSILNYFPQLRRPNYNVIANYCRNSLGAQIEETWFKGINRLLPAHNLIWQNGALKIYKYWEYPINTIKISLGEAKQIYRELFINAVKLRMRSDVPVGTMLSSGLDSSSIVCVLRKFYRKDHKTFTAVFNKNEFQKFEKEVYQKDIEINEGDLVKKIAKELKLEAHLINIKDIDFISELSDVIYYLESGHSSPAIIPLNRILEYAKKHVTVIMDGQGSDELLGGYQLRTLPWLLYEYFKRGDLSQLIKEIKEFKKHYSLSYTIKLFFRLLNYNWIERLYYSKIGVEKAFGPKLQKYSRIRDYPSKPLNFDDSFNKELFKSHTGGLVNLLHYGDAISMSKSMEARNPFLDVNLVEFAFKLQSYFKMYNGLGKYIHRVAMDGIVPKSILENPIKFGFNVPLSQYFNNLNNESNSILLSKKCFDRSIFNRNGLQNLISEHIKKKKNNSTILFRLLSVELWFRRFID